MENFAQISVMKQNLYYNPWEIKESSIEISVSSMGEFCIITYTVLYYLKYIFFDPI